MSMAPTVAAIGGVRGMHVVSHRQEREAGPRAGIAPRVDARRAGQKAIVEACAIDQLGVALREVGRLHGAGLRRDRAARRRRCCW